MGTVSSLISRREEGLQRCCWTPRGWDNDKTRGGGSFERGRRLSWFTCDKRTWDLLLDQVPMCTLEVENHTFYRATGKPFKHMYFLLHILCCQMGILKLYRMETLKNNSQLVYSRRNWWVKRDYFYSVEWLSLLKPLMDTKGDRTSDFWMKTSQIQECGVSNKRRVY